MSDGPHRSLNMNRSWKRLAEYADNDAYSLDDVAQAFLPAMEQSCNEEVPDHLWRELTRIFDDKQGKLFGEQRVDEIAALRSGVAGYPLAGALVDAAEQAASRGQGGAESLVAATTQALLTRAASGNRQIEEHYYRESDGKRSKNVRDRMERALTKAALEPMARQRLNVSGAAKVSRSSKQSDLDDGVLL